MRVLHVLPHAGGGAETYVDALEHGLGPDIVHARTTLSAGRAPLQGLVSIPRRYRHIARDARTVDVLHVHGDLAAILCLPLLSRRAVITTHGLHLSRRASGPAGLAVRAGLRAASQRCGKVICTSEHERGELRALVPADRMTVVRNAISPAPPRDDAARAAVRRELGLASDDIAALFVGELEERKRALFATMVTRAVRADGTRLHLLVAGDGAQREQLAAQAGDGIHALGFRRDVDRLLAAADLFVLPSAHEGLSYALLEAMAHGVPAVVSDGPGNPEAANGTGTVVALDDGPGWTAALRALAHDPEQRSRLGEAARERVARDGDERRFVVATREVYETLR